MNVKNIETIITNPLLSLKTPLAEEFVELNSSVIVVNYNVLYEKIHMFY